MSQKSLSIFIIGSQFIKVSESVVFSTNWNLYNRNWMLFCLEKMTDVPTGGSIPALRKYYVNFFNFSEGCFHAATEWDNSLAHPLAQCQVWAVRWPTDSERCSLHNGQALRCYSAPRSLTVSAPQTSLLRSNTSFNNAYAYLSFPCPFLLANSPPLDKSRMLFFIFRTFIISFTEEQ